jgi:osmotically-inducible protein OsmY
MPCFSETTESRAAMENLALGSRARAALALAPPTSDLEVAVVAQAGTVTVRGHLPSGDRLAEVEEIVRRVPGVSAVRLQNGSDVDF